MSETVLVTVKSGSTSRKAAPTSRIRIPKDQFNPDIHTMEEDQGCEGPTLEEAVKMRNASKSA